MFGKKKSLKERVKELKSRPDRRYFTLGLMSDFAALIEKGMADAKVSQRELGDLSGLGESRISKYSNATVDNFKISAIAKALIPLGIVPRLVDAAELAELRRKAEVPEVLKTVLIAASAANDTFTTKILSAQYGRGQSRSRYVVRSIEAREAPPDGASRETRTLSTVD